MKFLCSCLFALKVGDTANRCSPMAPVVEEQRLLQICVTIFAFIYFRKNINFVFLSIATNSAGVFLTLLFIYIFTSLL